tara:strand:+ start:2349 stop:3071 length:723 start_codon:yes stop_codon:yes gene_type:complete
MSFTRIFPRELDRLSAAGLSASAILVYMALAARCYDDEEGSVYPNHDTISNDLGGNYSRSSIEKAVKKLVDAGLIKRNSPRSKKRYILIVRKVAIFEHELETKSYAAEKSSSQLPSHVTDKTRSMLRQKKNNVRTLFLSKSEISELGQIIQAYNIGSWPSNFLIAIQKKALAGKALKKGQVTKYLQLRKKHRGVYGDPQIESGGKGEQLESLDTDQSHPEIGKPEWGSPQWQAQHNRHRF